MTDHHKQRVQMSLNTFYQRQLEEQAKAKAAAENRRKRSSKPAPEYPYESFEQGKLSNWLNKSGVLWCHVANERRTSKMHGAHLRGRGVKAGVPDVLIFRSPPNSRHKGVAIELKRVRPAPSKVSHDQKIWLQRLEEEGWLARVCYGHKEAIAWLESLGFTKDPPRG